MTETKRGDLRYQLVPGVNETVDPIRLARRDLRKSFPLRFFTEVTVSAVQGGFGVLLDGKPVRTPAKAWLAVPSVELAEALAKEWRAQGDVIEPDTMPMTRLANSAIDGVASAMAATADEIARFAETDLVCYRAGDPATLVEAQSNAWDPVLTFARTELGARFVCVEGVMHVAQPRSALLAVRAAVDAVAAQPHGHFGLAALSVTSAISGSVLIALALARTAMTFESAWSAAHVDEDHQMRTWGEDRDAMTRREHRRRDMEAAVRLQRLIPIQRR